MKSIGLKPVYDIPARNNPLPWTAHWISSKGLQVAPQETEVESYIVGGIKQDVKKDTFSGFKLQMKAQSAKAKGRRLQQWVRDQLIEQLDVHPEDIESRSMGAGGEDLIMARAARQKFPYSIECKNVEKLNIWEAYSQATANSGNYEPICVTKKNNVKPLVVLDAEYFIDLCSKLENGNT